MKVYFFKIIFILVFFITNSLYSQNKIVDDYRKVEEMKCNIIQKEDFQKWVELRLLGKADYCENNGEIFDAITKNLGFYANITREEGMYEGEFIPSKETITVFGYKVKKIAVYKDSGISFSVYLEAIPQELLKIVEDQKMKTYPFEDENEDFMYGFLTSKPSDIYPYGVDQKAILINKTDQTRISYIEFWDIDY